MRLIKRSVRAGHGEAVFSVALMLRECMGRWVPDTLKLLRLVSAKGVRDAEVLLAQVNELN